MPEETLFISDSDSNKEEVPRWNSQRDTETVKDKGEKKKTSMNLTEELLKKKQQQQKKKKGFVFRLIQSVKVIFLFVFLVVAFIVVYFFLPDAPPAQELMEQFSYFPTRATHAHQITVYPLLVGYMKLPKAMVQGSTEENLEKLPILCFLIEHSSYGKILYNAGFAENIQDRLKKNNWLSQKLKMEVEIVSTTKAELAKKGISPDQISRIFLGSLEWDCADGILDFPPSTTIYAPAEDIQYAKEYSKVSTRFWSDHLKEGITPLEFPRMSQTSGFLTFENCLRIGAQSLEGTDDSLVLVPTPGASPGHFSMIVSYQPKKRLFLTGNAVWFESQLKNTNAPPSENTDPTLENDEKFPEDLPRLGRKTFRFNTTKSLTTICQFALIKNNEPASVFYCNHDPVFNTVSFPQMSFEGKD